MRLKLRIVRVLAGFYAAIAFVTAGTILSGQETPLFNAPSQITDLVERHRLTVERLRVCYCEFEKTSDGQSSCRVSMWSGPNGVRLRENIIFYADATAPEGRVDSDTYWDIATGVCYKISRQATGNANYIDLEKAVTTITPCQQNGVRFTQDRSLLSWAYNAFGSIQLASFHEPPNFEGIDELIRRFERVEYLGASVIDDEKCEGIRLTSANLGTMDLFMAIDKGGLYKRIVSMTPQYEVERKVEEYRQLADRQWFPVRISVRQKNKDGEWDESNHVEVDNIITQIETFPNGDDPRFGFRYPQYAEVIVVDPGQSANGLRHAELVIMGENEKPLYRPRDMFDLDKWCKDNGFPGNPGLAGGPPPESRANKGVFLAITIGLALFAMLAIITTFLRRKRKATIDDGTPSIG